MYKTVKTTLGHKYRMRMAEDEKAERILFWFVLTALPFIGAAGMTFIWMKGV